MKSTLNTIIAAVVICAFAVSGCGNGKPLDKRVLAKVSSRTITVADFDSRIENIPVYYRNIVKQNKKRYLNEIILETLFYEDAIRKGLDKEKDILTEAKKKIMVSKLIKIEVDDKLIIPESDVMKLYEERKMTLKTPELWRASHILIADEAQAKLILDELSKGANFEDLAKKYSIDATAARGGDIGYFREGQLVPEFEKVCMNLDIGQTGEILKTQIGYHIIKLTGKKDPAVQSFSEARLALESELKKKKRGVLFDEMVLKLKDRYGVNIEEDVFESIDTKDKPKEEAVK
jgi:peptidyl-prolyl cis-trans isomerase C